MHDQIYMLTELGCVRFDCELYICYNMYISVALYHVAC